MAVVLVAGPGATWAVGTCFRALSGKPLAELPLGRIALGRWGGAEGEELIVCRRADEEIEIHCHGGVAAVGAVVGRLVELGCTRATWQQWLRSTVGPPSRGGPELSVPLGSRHLLSRPGDAVRCAAQIALADAPTARTAAVLLDQFHGALTTAIESVIAAVGHADWRRAAETLDALLAFRELGLHLTEAWRVVLAGAPNVGKSSLINALAGYQRAIVSAQPGTTRDVVTTTTAIAGWPVQLADTAGLRDSADALESAGVALAADALSAADLVIAVHDISRGLAAGEGAAGEGDRHILLRGLRKMSQSPNIAALSPIAALPPHVRILDVHNKIDLADADQRRAVAAGAGIATSAITGKGLADLVNAIGRALVPVAPAAGAAVPFTVAQIAGLETARQAVERRDASGAKAALTDLLTRC